MADNFTDADGTPLENHTPDGGGVPFAWQRPTSPTVAHIQNDAVGYDQGGGWEYLTSLDAGDAVELAVEVPSEPVVDHNIAILLRATTSGTTLRGYYIYWIIYGGGWGSDISIETDHSGLFYTSYATTAPSPGTHSFKAEIVSNGVINVYVDGSLAATVTDPNPIPAGGRAGISFFTGGTGGTTRVTAFTALPWCAPVGDPVADNFESRQLLLSELALSRQNANPNTGQGRVERCGYVMQRQSDQSIFLVAVPTLSATDCNNEIGPEPSIPGASVYGVWHTHPSKLGEHFFTCPNAPPNATADPLGNGGGSDTDWNSALTSGFPIYVIGTPGVLSRLDDAYATPKSARSSNTKRWSIDQSNASHCPTQGVTP